MLQNSYTMKKLDFQRDVLECKDLFAQFSKQLQDACLTFGIEIDGGRLPEPSIPWFSYDFQSDIASEQPVLEQNAGRLYSSELTKAEENGEGQEREADEVVKNFPHLLFQSRALYLVCTIFTVVDWLFYRHEIQKGVLVRFGRTRPG